MFTVSYYCMLIRLHTLHSAIGWFECSLGSLHRHVYYHWKPLPLVCHRMPEKHALRLHLEKMTVCKICSLKMRNLLVAYKIFTISCPTKYVSINTYL